MYKPEFFEWKEFKCPCCGVNLIEEELVKKLDELRLGVGYPLIINSGYRCDVHNEMVGGVKQSLHRSGRAADIRTHHLSGKRLWDLYQMVFILGFTGIGIYKGFLHVDIRRPPHTIFIGD